MRQPIALCVLAITMFLWTNLVSAEDINRKIPPCELQSLIDQRAINLNQFKGQVIYVDFWASWCGPCAKSFPFMNTLDRDLKDQGLQLIGINLDENIEEAKQFLAKYPSTFTTAIDNDKQCARNFGVKAMPSSYLIDRNGIIRHLHLGFRPGEAEQFRKLVEQLLAENKKKPVPK